MDPDPASLGFVTLLITESPVGITLSVLAILILLLISAMMSGSEVAFFSLTKSEIDDFRSKTSRTDKALQFLLSQPKKLLATILIMNNLVNVAIILLATLIVRDMQKVYNWDEIVLYLIEVVAITFLLLFFGEITPKVFAASKRIVFVKLLALPIRIFCTALTPLSWILINSTSFVDKRLNLKKDQPSFEDIKNAIELYSDEESPEEEKDILKGIVNFSSTSVRSIMRARVDVKAVDSETSFEELIDLVNEYGFSRLPIYEENLDSIKGVLHVKDLLPLLSKDVKDKSWQNFIREPYFVPEMKKIDDLLDEFKSKRNHLAIVVDEFGGTSGIVTLEDVIEEIFGEINDEFDEEELVFSKISENDYIFDGKMPLNDIVKQTGLPDGIFDNIRGESDSLAGLVLEIHGKIPEKEEVIAHEWFIFKIESVSQHRIKRIKLTILEAARSATPSAETA